MDAPEPGQGPSDAAESRAGQPDGEEDLLAAMQAARGGEATDQAANTGDSGDSGSAAPSEAGPVASAGESPKAGDAPARPGRRRLVAVVGLLAALVIAAGALFAVGGFLSPAASPSNTASSAPSPVASGTTAGSTSPSGSAVSAASAASASAVAASAIVPATVQPSASQSLPAQTAPTAQVTFNEVVLYPSITAAKQAATFAFVSDGPGRVSASIVASAPRDASRICLSGDGGTPVCASGATPTATFYSQSIQSKWTVTVGSANEESPTVDVQLTWPSNKASVTASHVPFQGHPNRDSLRSLTATFTARAAESAVLDARWPGSSLTTSLTVWLVDKSGQREVDRKSFAAAEALPASTGFVAKAGATYRMTLANDSDVSATNPDLTATLQLP